VSRQGFEKFFDQYGRALSAGDLETIVECFAPPSIIVDDSSTTLMVDRKELLQYFNGIEDRYQAAGAFSATASVGAVEQLSPTLWLVDVRWDSFDESGAPALVDVETYKYLLRNREPEAMVIVAALVTEST
jgi:hypothetical protein